jgi:type IV secretory pathway ATPase VirB11/archaellum biosynthesis ATPase
VNGSVYNKKDEIVKNGISSDRCAAEIIAVIAKKKEILVAGSTKENVLLP